MGTCRSRRRFCGACRWRTCRRDLQLARTCNLHPARILETLTLLEMTMNARERLAAAAEWLGYNDEQLSFGLRNAFDALRLYDYAQAHPNLPEMADEWEESDLIAALGYSPFEFDQTEAMISHEANTSGADKAAKAMRAA